MLFHEDRALQLLSEHSRQVIEENVFDDVLHAIHSNLVYTDPRIVSFSNIRMSAVNVIRCLDSR